MYGEMSVIMQTINMGTNCFAAILALNTSQPLSNKLFPLGNTMHLITSTAIWDNFVIITSKFNRSRVTEFESIGFLVLLQDL